MTTRDRLAALGKSMDEAVEGLKTFDAEGLESLEQRIRAVTAEYRAHGLTDARETLPELLRKHSLLQAVLKATAANLKVMETAFEARLTRANDRRNDTHGYPNRTAQPVEERSAGEPNRA